MRLILGLTIYRLLLPLLFLAAFPGWLVKMLRRGGFGSRLGERAAIYSASLNDEPRGAVHLHAVSVGEAMLALKLIREWLACQPAQRFVLATGTATGHAVATAANLPGLRVTYAPLDFPGMVRRYLHHFEPAQIILVEAEAWPHLLLACRRRHIPISLVNARLSPRSAARYLRWAAWVRPVFGMLDALAIQDPEDAAIWLQLGVAAEKIHATGSLKIDPGSGQAPTRRPAFQAMIEAVAGPGQARPVVLAASTHPGEEPWIASAIRMAVPAALILIVPRHAERRAQVKADLERNGFEVVLRSSFPHAHGRDENHDENLQEPHAPPARVPSSDLTDTPPACLVIDTTGELRDWTAHADVVIIGKSFLATGGQNPCEAILAGKPVIFGPHMENFEPLASRLLAAHAAFLAPDPAGLSAAIVRALDPAVADGTTTRAAALLQRHHGATRRIVELLIRP
jgi:3-deoxy-D-manno-octulosonic-acid transferase